MELGPGRAIHSTFALKTSISLKRSVLKVAYNAVPMNLKSQTSID